MPDAAIPYIEVSRQQTPVLQESKPLSLPRISSFPAYEVDDMRTSTPDPIKVTSKKKKGTGKKKRTQNPTTEATNSR
jgi:AP-3 complex subunit delta-1